MSVSKLFVVAVLIAIIASLASAFFHLLRDKGESDQTVKALTLRVALSIGLFILLMIGWATGLITPHGL